MPGLGNQLLMTGLLPTAWMLILHISALPPCISSPAPHLSTPLPSFISNAFLASFRSNLFKKKHMVSGLPWQSSG